MPELLSKSMVANVGQKPNEGVKAALAIKFLTSGVATKLQLERHSQGAEWTTVRIAAVSRDEI